MDSYHNQARIIPTDFLLKHFKESFQADFSQHTSLFQKNKVCYLFYNQPNLLSYLAYCCKIIPLIVGEKEIEGSGQVLVDNFSTFIDLVNKDLIENHVDESTIQDMYDFKEEFFS